MFFLVFFSKTFAGIKKSSNFAGDFEKIVLNTIINHHY